MPSLSSTTSIATVGILLLILVIGYFLWTSPDRRNTGEKIGDALNELQKGSANAVQKLENRTPGEKIQDVAKDMKEDAQKSLDRE